MKINLIYHTAGRVLRVGVTSLDGKVLQGSCVSASPRRVQEYIMGALTAGHRVTYIALP